MKTFKKLVEEAAWSIFRAIIFTVTYWALEHLLK